MKAFGILALVTVLGSSLQTLKAEFSIYTEYAALFQSDGTTQIGAGFIGILVADEGTTPGIASALDTILNVGNYLGGSSDDRIIGLTTSVANVAATGYSGFQQDFTSLSYSGNFNAGDKLYLLWFPTISVAGSTVGDAVSYGVYRTDTINVASGANIAFIAPADNNLYDMSAYLDSIAPGSGVTPAQFTASAVTAVPEPSACMLLVTAALGAALLRIGRHRRQYCQASR
jgi:hypothetical protein